MGAHVAVRAAQYVLGSCGSRGWFCGFFMSIFSNKMIKKCLKLKGKWMLFLFLMYLCLFKMEQSGVWRGRGAGMLQCGLLLFFFLIVGEVSVKIWEQGEYGALCSVLSPREIPLL